MKSSQKKINNLVIGNTSQLSHFFPNEYIKISSRDINFKSLLEINWDRVFICIGESRKFIDEIEMYEKVNFDLTLEIINKLKFISNKIIIYSTCELWNKYDGRIDISLPINFYETPYLNSKYKICNYILNNQKEFKNVIILFPFNFNSIYRDNNFLFGKIFNSIINKTKIEIGDTYFYRDLIHPKYVVKKSIELNLHSIIGSARLTFVNDFIRDLYKKNELNYEDFVIENKNKFNEYERKKEYYLKNDYCLYSYTELLNDTLYDINLKKNKKIC